MTTLPHPWGEYAQLQQKLARTRRLDTQSWGTESALNDILDIVQQGFVPSGIEITRSAATARRRERNRAKLRLVYLDVPEGSVQSEQNLLNRSDLVSLHSQVTAQDWAILTELSSGRTYADLAAVIGTKPGTLRVRVLRLRKRLHEQLDEAA